MSWFVLPLVGLALWLCRVVAAVTGRGRRFWTVLLWLGLPLLVVGAFVALHLVRRDQPVDDVDDPLTVLLVANALTGIAAIVALGVLDLVLVLLLLRRSGRAAAGRSDG